MSSYNPLRAPIGRLQPRGSTPLAGDIQTFPWRRLALVPLLLFTLSVTTIELFSLDLRLADLLYQLEGHDWALRDNWITENLIHNGGRLLSFAFLFVLLLLWGLT